MSRYLPNFGAAVRSLYRERKLTARGASELTGINHATLTTMGSRDYVPTLETLLLFIERLNLDPSIWLPLAGYPVPVTGEVALVRRLAALVKEEPGKVIPIEFFEGMGDGLTIEEARRRLLELEDRLLFGGED